MDCTLFERQCISSTNLAPEPSKPDGESDFNFVEVNDLTLAVARVIGMVQSQNPIRLAIAPN